MIQVARLEAFVFRAPVETPVRTSFGVMRDRPAVFIRAIDADGTAGWGEAWCNFPAVGAEHRVRLVASVLAPLIEQKRFADPRAAFDALSSATAVLAIQSGEHGPLAQAVAGVDIALWDLFSRKQKAPLWKLLGGKSSTVPLYASGLNPDAPEKLAAAKAREGYRSFKLKVGFGLERDVSNLRALRDTLGGEAGLMVDANQGWNLAAALETAPRLEPFRLGWLEEPLRADRPWHEWSALKQAIAIPLAGGENLFSDESFTTALEARALSVVQPDLGKWGGFSGCLPVARRVLAAGRRYCPHWLGGGIGLLASAHLLAAAGGDGLLEVDANPNPLRERLCPPLGSMRDGAIRLDDTPGLGEVPDPLETLKEFRTL